MFVFILTGPEFTILTLLYSLNSCVNPWIYLAFNRELPRLLLRHYAASTSNYRTAAGNVFQHTHIFGCSNNRIKSIFILFIILFTLKNLFSFNILLSIIFWIPFDTRLSPLIETRTSSGDQKILNTATFKDCRCSGVGFTTKSSLVLWLY